MCDLSMCVTCPTKPGGLMGDGGLEILRQPGYVLEKCIHMHMHMPRR